MAEWLIEEGIGEDRAVLVDNDRIVAAKLQWPGGLAPGLVDDAVLVSRAAGSTRGTARFAGGEEALVDRLPREAREGAALRLEVTRSALGERQRHKLARARPTSEEPRSAPSLAEALRGRVVRNLPGWEDVWTEGWTGAIAFAGGSLIVEQTAALTVIDVDGDLAPSALALAAAPAVAETVRRLDLAGAIVVDFPTLAAKPERQQIDAALRAALAGVPHETTAMNGFGLVQIVLRRERPSLLELLRDRSGAAARLLLRRAERVAEPGVLQLNAPAAVRRVVNAGWEAELARRTGRSIEWRLDEGLAPHGSFAQAVPP